MYKSRLEIRKETLDIIETGGYWIEDEVILLKLSLEQIQEAKVFLEKDVDKFRMCFPDMKLLSGNIVVKNMDSFEVAKELKENVLVLNFADAFNNMGIGSGQEADLWDRSTLSASLKSKDAKLYYHMHKKINSGLASDAVILSPNVEIIRDKKENLLKESVIVSVLSCAAPVFTKNFNDNGVGHYYQHESVGCYYLLSNLESVQRYGDYSDKQLLNILFLINYHMLPMGWGDEKRSEKWERTFGQEKYILILDFHVCDKAR